MPDKPADEDGAPTDMEVKQESGVGTSAADGQAAAAAAADAATDASAAAAGAAVAASQAATAVDPAAGASTSPEADGAEPMRGVSDAGQQE